MAGKNRELARIVEQTVSKNTELELKENEINLLELFRLIVDIKYRLMYGKTIAKAV